MGFCRDTSLHKSFGDARPLVSVILPVYNGGDYLADSIRSILSQSYASFEFIIVDDGSTDETPSIVESFHDPRIRFVRQENRGLPATLNVAIAMARGELLARQDADDISHPARLEKQVAFLESNPGCGVVGTWSEIFVDRTRTERSHRHPTSSPALAFSLLFNSYFVHSSVLMRRSVLSSVGLYCVERSRQPEDYELWSRILRNGGFTFANIPEQLVCYREIASSICRSGKLDFKENVAGLSAENLAWASGLDEPDQVCLDVAALLHDAPRRLSARPNLQAMQELLHTALLKICGGTVPSDDELTREYHRVRTSLRNQYLSHRYGPTAGKGLATIADVTALVRTGNRPRSPGCEPGPPAVLYEGASGGNGPAAEDGPSIDVVIPVYNGERYILRALGAAANQTRPPRRIIVVDDGSTDRTKELVGSFQSAVPIVYLFKENGGPSSARNVGIARCDSEYIAFLDADDEWLPSKLEEQAKVFRDGKGILGVVYSKYLIIDENGSMCSEDGVVEPDPAMRGRIFEKLLYSNRICGSCSGVMVKRECFERVGGFDEALSNCEDWDLWLRIAEFWEFDFIPRELVLIRRHAGNNQNDTFRMFNSRVLFYNKWISRLPGGADCFEPWRRLCITFVITQRPRTRFYAALSDNLSPENRRKLFGPSSGSIPVYMAFSLPRIMVGMLMYRLRAGR